MKKLEGFMLYVSVIGTILVYTAGVVTGIEYMKRKYEAKKAIKEIRKKSKKD